MIKSFTKTLTLIIALFISLPSKAIIYTAAQSGNFSSNSTWQGGFAPPVLSAGDVIIIPQGLNVMLGSDMGMAGNNAELWVDGILSAPGNDIVIQNVPLYGSGTVNVDSFAGGVGPTASFDFRGTINAKKLNTAFSSVPNAGTKINTDILYVQDTIIMTNGELAVANKIVVNNPNPGVAGPFLLTSGTGIYSTSNSYEVVYMGGSVRTGFELAGLAASKCKQVEVNVNPAAEVMCQNSLLLPSASLILTSGTLNLNNQLLTVSSTGDIMITGGLIKSSPPSEIEINKDISAELKFTQGSSVKDLVINVNNDVKLASDLKVAGSVDLQSGKLNVQDNTLSLVTGATVKNADAGKYIVTEEEGALAADIAPGASTTFHVGTAANYAPCNITSKNNTVYNGLMVGVYPEVKAVGATGKVISNTQPLVSATWFIGSPNATTVDADIQVQWSSSMEVNGFNRQKAYISLLNGAKWDSQSPKAATDNSGNYTISREGVKYFSAFAVFDENTVDVQDMEVADKMQLYPNPASNVLHIKNAPQGMATIHNTTGRLVKSVSLQQGANTIDVSSLAPGLYYLQAGTGNHTKFIKR